jgi:hypothetical protein
MYTYAPTGLAEVLGEPPKPTLSPALSTWLKGVRAKPGDFEVLLATATLHPKPAESRVWTLHNFTIGTQKRYLIDEILISQLSPQDIVDRLQRISAGYQKRSPAWRRTIQDAVTLRGEYMNALSVMGRLPQALGAFPLLTFYPPNTGEIEAWKLARLGYSFAKAKFPPKLAERMLKTPAHEAHYYMVGRWLQRYGEVLQTKDPAFKRQVDDKLALIKQIEKEKEQEQRQTQKQRRKP